MECFCECGCGQPTKIAQKTSTRDGVHKGEPLRFIHGHQGRSLDDATKVCSQCQREKSLSHFYRSSQTSDGYYAHCMACHIKYLEPQKDAALRKANYRDRNRAIVLQHLWEHPCVDCEEEDPVVLEFDHVRGDKVANISTLISKGAAVVRLLEEIAKCDVVCANCHRRRTARTQIWNKLKTECLEQ